MQSSSIITILHRSYAAICASVLVAGCSLSNSSLQQETSVLPAPTTVAIEFGEVDARQHMQQAALFEPFAAYWAAHVSRDWARLYSYELAELPLSLEFYVAYHARAWQVLRVEVLKVDLDGAEARLRLSVLVKDPKKQQTSVTYREDKWTRVDGTWRHRVTDPLLTAEH